MMDFLLSSTPIFVFLIYAILETRQRSRLEQRIDCIEEERGASKAVPAGMADHDPEWE